MCDSSFLNVVRRKIDDVTNFNYELEGNYLEELRATLVFKSRTKNVNVDHAYLNN